MFDKLRQVEERYRELTGSLSDPAVIGQQALYAKTAKAASELAEVVGKFEEYKQLLARLEEARHMAPRTPTGRCARWRRRRWPSSRRGRPSSKTSSAPCSYPRIPTTTGTSS